MSAKTLGFYTTLFIIPKKGGGLQPNLCPLNRFISYSKFRMETNQTILQSLQPGDWLASLDLKDAYFHVNIRPTHRPYLRFAYDDKVYQFRVLPFGLSSAPRVFTKILAPVVSLIRQRGVRFHPYLDDCLIVAKDPKSLRSLVQIAVSTLTLAGFTVNWQKSFPDPLSESKVSRHADRHSSLFGLPSWRTGPTSWSNVHLVFQAPEVPSSKAIHETSRSNSCLSSGSPSGAGDDEAYSDCTFCPNGQPRIIPFQIQMYFLSQWSAKDHPISKRILVPVSLIPHLRFWQTKDNLLQGVPLVCSPPSVEVETDACNTGWGGRLGQLKVQGLFQGPHKRFHINCKEMLAVQFSLWALLDQVKGRSVLVKTDNIAVRQYILNQGGTGSPALCALLLKLLHWCQSQGITLSAEYIPGVQNTLSRHPVQENSCPDRVVPESLGNTSTVCPVQGTSDRSVRHCVLNKKTPVFCSWRTDPQAFHTDAMSLCWSQLLAYAFPPIALLHRVLLKAREDQIPYMLLIAPLWPSHPWYPLLLRLLIEDPV